MASTEKPKTVPHRAGTEPSLGISNLAELGGNASGEREAAPVTAGDPGRPASMRTPEVLGAAGPADTASSTSAHTMPPVPTSVQAASSEPAPNGADRLADQETAVGSCQKSPPMGGFLASRQRTWPLDLPGAGAKFPSRQMSQPASESAAGAPAPNRGAAAGASSPLASSTGPFETEEAMSPRGRFIMEDAGRFARRFSDGDAGTASEGLAAVAAAVRRSGSGSMSLGSSPKPAGRPARSRSISKETTGERKSYEREARGAHRSATINSICSMSPDAQAEELAIHEIAESLGAILSERIAAELDNHTKFAMTSISNMLNDWICPGCQCSRSSATPPKMKAKKTAGFTGMLRLSTPKVAENLLEKSFTSQVSESFDSMQGVNRHSLSSSDDEGNDQPASSSFLKQYQKGMRFLQRDKTPAPSNFGTPMQSEGHSFIPQDGVSGGGGSPRKRDSFNDGAVGVASMTVSDGGGFAANSAGIHTCPDLGIHVDINDLLAFAQSRKSQPQSAHAAIPEEPAPQQAIDQLPGVCSDAQASDGARAPTKDSKGFAITCPDLPPMDFARSTNLSCITSPVIPEEREVSEPVWGSSSAPVRSRIRSNSTGNVPATLNRAEEAAAAAVAVSTTPGSSHGTSGSQERTPRPADAEGAMSSTALALQECSTEASAFVRAPSALKDTNATARNSQRTNSNKRKPWGFRRANNAPTEMDRLEQALNQQLFRATSIDGSSRFALPSERKQTQQRLRAKAARDWLFEGVTPSRKERRVTSDTEITRTESSKSVITSQEELGNHTTTLDGHVEWETGTSSVFQKAPKSYAHWQIQAEKDATLMEDPHEAHSEWEAWRSSSCTERIKHIPRILPHMVGALPWSRTRRYSSMAYQIATLVVACGCTLYFAYEAHETDQVVSSPGFLLDTCIALGGLFGLLACGAHRQSQSLVDCEDLLIGYAYRRGFMKHWQNRVWRTAAIGLLMWALAVPLRAAFPLHDPRMPVTNIVAFAFSSAVHVGLAAYTLQTCGGLSMMVDSFICSLIQQPDFAAAMKEWNLIQALCRTVSRTLEIGFLVSQTVALVLALLCVASWGSEEIPLLAVLPGLLVVLTVVYASIVAAAVTDKCGRVSAIANSITVEKDFDPDRMYVVEHIQHSQAGLYVFGVRVTSPSILKSLYIACAMAFAFATRAV